MFKIIHYYKEDVHPLWWLSCVCLQRSGLEAHWSQLSLWGIGQDWLNRPNRPGWIGRHTDKWNWFHFLLGPLGSLRRGLYVVECWRGFVILRSDPTIYCPWFSFKPGLNQDEAALCRSAQDLWKYESKCVTSLVVAQESNTGGLVKLHLRRVELWLLHEIFHYGRGIPQVRRGVDIDKNENL